MPTSSTLPEYSATPVPAPLPYPKHRIWQENGLDFLFSVPKLGFSVSDVGKNHRHFFGINFFMNVF
jgi:hypothetical protein